MSQSASSSASTTNPAAIGSASMALASILPILTPACPCPPYWDEALDTAVHGYTPYQKIPVGETSDEYRILCSLIGSETGKYIEITGIELVVNEGLWTRFANTRKELVAKKSDNLALLPAFGLTEKDVHRRAQLALNFNKNDKIPAYMDNVALLFHCTRGNLEDVLTQGLDERLGNGGLVGKGIYFSDDPLKSLSYDSHGVLMIFAVFLGDCYSAQHMDSPDLLVREPGKAADLMRNREDLFFDSVVFRFNNEAANEYVIYNRFQCCPLYAISYVNTSGGAGVDVGITAQVPDDDIYAQARKKFPPFAWIKEKPPTAKRKGKKGQAHNNIAGSSHTAPEAWPFFAQTIFGLMDGNRWNQNTTLNSVPVPVLANMAVDDEDDGGEADIVMKVSMITELGIRGYSDYADIEPILRRFGFSVERTIDYVLQIEAGRSPFGPAQAQAQRSQPRFPSPNVVHGSVKGQTGTPMPTLAPIRIVPAGPPISLTMPPLSSSATMKTTQTITKSKGKRSPRSVSPPFATAVATAAAAAKRRMRKYDDTITRVIGQFGGANSGPGSQTTVAGAAGSSTVSSSTATSSVSTNPVG